MLHYQEWGSQSAPPLVLLHDINENRHAWGEVAKLAAANYRVLSVDLRGHALQSIAGGGKVPCIVIYFDDILGSQIMIGKGAREIARICLFHRHLGGFTDPNEHGAVGASLLFNAQAWKTNVGGLPKALRNNLTLMILFKTKSEKELQEIAEEVSGEVSEKTFYDVYNQAIQESHDFLMVDLHKKSSHFSSFRRNFNEFIVPTK